MKVTAYSEEIRELCREFKLGRIILDPPYQRRPAWTTRQRWDLLGSIFNGIPVPAVLFYRTSGPKGAVRYEVMDGKQRLETIFHFRYGGIIRGEQRLGFWLRRDDSKKREWFYYKDLKTSANKKSFGLSTTKFLDYKLPIVEYSGELVGLAGQKIAEKEIFAKINSTGSKLTKNEIRHAQSSPFFDMGSRLETRWKRKLVEKWRVFSKAEVSRYQYHEFMLELCTVVQSGGISDRRKALENFMRMEWRVPDLRQCERNVSAVLQWMTLIFRNVNFLTTRFHKKSDFYTLFAILAVLRQRGAVTTDTRLNSRARLALIEFSKRADKIDGSIVKYLPGKLSIEDRDFAKYIVSTREATDQKRNRLNREEVLRPLLETIFKKRKSPRRAFGRAEKRLLWLESEPWNGKIKCPNPDGNHECIGRMSFDECEVDHRKAYVHGGETIEKNAQLLCKSCNRRKGAR